MKTQQSLLGILLFETFSKADADDMGALQTSTT